MTPITQNPLQEKRRRRSEAHRATTYGHFLNDLCDATGYERDFAENAATTVLGCLEQRMTRQVAAHMEAQLPATLRELIAASATDRGLEPRKVHRQEFVTMVAENLSLTPQEAESVARSVLALIRSRISEGEALLIEKQLPLDLRELWWPPI